MRKLLISILLLFSAASLFSSPVEITPRNNAYTYVGFTSGYGYTFIENADAHAFAFGVETGHIYDSFSLFQIGFGIRSDGLANIKTNNLGSTSFNLLIGAAFVFDISSALTLNAVIGPALSLQDSTLLSVAPALDLNLELKATGNFSLKLGCALYGQIGVTEWAFGLSVSPYLGMTAVVPSRKDYFEKIDYLR